MEIRPWQVGDDLLAAAAERFISTAGLNHRFLVGTGGRLPAAYRRHIAAGPRPTWDAQVAAGDGMLYGWAEFGRVPDVVVEADIAVIVADPWHRQGVATALLRTMLPRVIAAGVTTIHADVLPTNRAAHALLRSVFGAALRPGFHDGIARYEISLAHVRTPQLVGRPG